ncbi:MAG: BTAD domain-containing putative transcriptional regulator [Anaerolineae bacterium]
MLDIKLFNGFQARLNDQPLTRFRSAKARALFVYLLQESDRPHNRGRLAGLLWPDFPDGTARRNLSQTLSSLRKTLDESQFDNPYIETTTQTVTIHRSKLADGVLAVDTLAFERLAQSADIKSLQQAADLYTGPFLAQFQGGDSDLFENWATAQQERFQQLALNLFSKLAELLAEQNEIESAISFVRRQLAIAPWQESAHRQLMHLLALDGRRIEALGQYDTLCDVLMAELGVSPAPETNALYDQILAGELKPIEAARVEITPAPSIPFQAPPQPPHFVGRELELAEVTQLVAPDSNQSEGRAPIALVGMGGIGKTAFAIHQAHRLKEQFSDGVLWGNTMTSGPAAILDLWAKAYGYDYSGLGDLESKASAVRSLLANKQALIVLDNVEDVAQVRPLLPNSPTCSVLLTTRNLDIASALNARPVALQELTAENSQQLMVKILGEDRIFNMTGGAAATQRIGELLHHLPLAVEIVAQRLKSRIQMPIAAMALRLEDTQQRLGLEISDQAVRASFEISWDGLPPMAQQVFRGMGIFGGRSFSAEALAASLDLDLFETEDQLYSLTALSLVTADGKVRRRQHPLLADFALEQLQTVDTEPIFSRFFDYATQFANNNKNDYEKLSAEWENLAAAIQAASQQKKWQTVLDLMQALSKPWLSYSRFYDAQLGYQAAEEAAKQLDAKLAFADVCLNSAEVEIELSNYNKAWGQLHAAYEIFASEEDDFQIAQVKYHQGVVLLEQGEFEKAQHHLKESDQLLSQLDKPREHGRTRSLLGWLYFEAEENLLQAKEMALNSLSILNDLKEDETLISSFRLLAFIAIREEALTEAEDWSQKALELGKKLNNLAEIGATYYLLVAIERKNNRLEQAKIYVDEGLSIFKKLGNKRLQGLLLQEQAANYCSEQDFEQGKKCIKKSIALFHQIEDRLNYAYSLRTLGAIHNELNEPSLRNDAWTEAYQIATHINHPNLKNQMATMLKDVGLGV